MKLFKYQSKIFSSERILPFSYPCLAFAFVYPVYKMFTRILVLGWADILSDFALWTLMIYLTDVWKLSFTHAAAILNIYMGLIGILPLFMQVIVDTLTGHYWMLLSSSIAYCTGLGLLSMSTPPVLSKVSGNCGSYQPECVGDTQHILFYFALPLLAAGTAGHIVSLLAFIGEQFASTLEDGAINASSVFTAQASNLALYAVTIFAVWGHPYIKPWSLHFGIPAIFTLVATLLFLSGSSTYTYVRPQGSPLTLVIRVLVASASKLFHQTPADPNALHQALTYNPTAHSLTAHRTRGLRCLNKAAIVLPDQSVEEQEKNRWKLCTVSEVEGTKLIISLIPMTMPFIFIGLLSTLGMTFFVEQAKNMNRKVGSLTIPLPIFWYFYLMGKKFFNIVSFVMRLTLSMDAQTKDPILGPLVSMLLGVLCTVTAAKVESRRLDVVKSHGLFDKPDDTVPMSVFWLLPQFILLGATDGMSEMCRISFFESFFAASLNNYMALIGSIGNGLGCIGSILAVYVLGKISERGGKPSWFQETINQSRLDNYYWFLASLCAINFVMYAVLRLCRKGKIDEDEQESPHQESDSCCCLC